MAAPDAAKADHCGKRNNKNTACRNDTNRKPVILTVVGWFAKRSSPRSGRIPFPACAKIDMSGNSHSAVERRRENSLLRLY